MAEGSTRPDSTDSKLREIESSIAEGRMMLSVLRSLPPSENNEAFIVRFEELVSRLEEYKQKNIKDPVGDGLRSQLKALKAKQDKIQSILDKTASEFQNTIAAANLGGTPKTIAQGSEGLPVSAPNLLSKFETLLSETSLSANVEVPDNKNGVLQNSDGLQVDTTSNHGEEFDWSTYFNAQISELQDLIDESERFDGMVQRLASITKKACLHESTTLLVDISKRFVELRKNFDSLKESYNAVGREPNLPDALRKIQLVSFREFLLNLTRNLESTKECFFTVHHLVKAAIEENVAEGTLRNIDNSDGDQEPTSANTCIPAAYANDNEFQTKNTVQPNESEHDVENELPPELVKQHAYLAALQQRTAQEREEVSRLLKQRDQLAERLASLRTAASRTTSEDQSKSITEDLQKSFNSQSSDQTSLLQHLESKKRELDDLKAQLSILRKAEAKIASLSPILPQNFSAESQINLVNGSDDTCLTQFSRENSIKPTHGAKTRFSEKFDRDMKNVEFLDAETNTDEISSTFIEKIGSDSFHPPKTTCMNNTERLYENIREARIRREEQRSQPCRTNDMVIANGLSLENPKGQTISCGGASVATSQDRTTLATWGGSSPIPSSSSNASDSVEEEDGVSVSGSLPINSVAVISNAHQPRMQNFTSDTVNNIAVKLPKAVGRRSERRGHSCKNMIQDQNKCLHLDTKELSKLSLPQVGRSPSPPNSRKGPVCESQSDKQLEFANLSLRQGIDTPNRTISAAVNIDCEDARMSEISSNTAAERMHRLETNVSQLYQICRCLMLENAYLNSAFMQLLMQSTLPSVAPNPSQASFPNNPAMYYVSHASSDVYSMCQTMLQRQQQQLQQLSMNMNRSTDAIQPSGCFDNLHVQILNQLSQQREKIECLQFDLQHLSQQQAGLKHVTPTPVMSSLPNPLISPLDSVSQQFSNLSPGHASLNVAGDVAMKSGIFEPVIRPAPHFINPQVALPQVTLPSWSLSSSNPVLNLNPYFRGLVPPNSTHSAGLDAL